MSHALGKIISSKSQTQIDERAALLALEHSGVFKLLPKSGGELGILGFSTEQYQQRALDICLLYSFLDFIICSVLHNYKSRMLGIKIRLFSLLPEERCMARITIEM